MLANSLKSWLNSWLRPFAPSAKRVRKKIRARYRPHFDVLEDRTTPALYIVTSTFDTGENTLDWAVQQANANAGADQIVFELTDGSFVNVSNTLQINGDLTIDGGGANLTVNGAGSSTSGILQVNSGNVSISNLAFTGNYLAGTAIRNLGANLDLQNLHIYGNTATYDGTQYAGGGVYSAGGTLDISFCTIEDNDAYDYYGRAYGGGVAIYGSTVTIANSVIQNNDANGYGGGIYQSGGSVTITYTDINDNRALDNGEGTQEAGGGIFKSSGTLDLQFVYLLGNRTSSYGGAVYNQTGNLSIDSSFISGNQANLGYGGGIVNDNGVLELTNSTVSENWAITSGGGIVNLSTATAYITNSTISDNGPYPEYQFINVAGGIDNLGLMYITTSTIYNNQAWNGGGGIWNRGQLFIDQSVLSANSASGGGGFLNSDSGTYEITNSLFYNNSGSLGGGIYHEAGSGSIVNSTIASNNAGTEGGGIAFGAYSAGQLLTLVNVTIADNTSANGGGLASSDARAVSLQNTLVARNFDYDPNGTLAHDVLGAFTSAGHNLIGDSSGSVGFTNGVSGDIVGNSQAPIDPLLDWFDFYAGTYPLLPGSLAIDAGANTGLLADQRGELRSDGAFDIGAFEVQPPPTVFFGSDDVYAGAEYELTIDFAADSYYEFFINWGDGSTDDTRYIYYGAPVYAYHTYAEGPNGFTITAQIDRGEGFEGVPGSKQVNVLVPGIDEGDATSAPVPPGAQGYVVTIPENITAVVNRGPRSTTTLTVFLAIYSEPPVGAGDGVNVVVAYNNDPNHISVIEPDISGNRVDIVSYDLKVRGAEEGDTIIVSFRIPPGTLRPRLYFFDEDSKSYVKPEGSTLFPGVSFLQTPTEFIIIFDQTSFPNALSGLTGTVFTIIGDQLGLNPNLNVNLNVSLLTLLATNLRAAPPSGPDLTFGSLLGNASSSGPISTGAAQSVISPSLGRVPADPGVGAAAELEGLLNATGGGVIPKWLLDLFLQWGIMLPVGAPPAAPGAALAPEPADNVVPAANPAENLGADPQTPTPAPAPQSQAEPTQTLAPLQRAEQSHSRLALAGVGVALGWRQMLGKLEAGPANRRGRKAARKTKSRHAG